MPLQPQINGFLAQLLTLLIKEKVMSLIKEKVVDQITVTENGTVLYREATRFIENGIELTKTYHRNSLQPGQDLTDVPANVVAIANAAWTPDVVTAYKEAQNDNLNT